LPELGRVAPPCHIDLPSRLWQRSPVFSLRETRDTAESLENPGRFTRWTAPAQGPPRVHTASARSREDPRVSVGHGRERRASSPVRFRRTPEFAAIPRLVAGHERAGVSTLSPRSRIEGYGASRGASEARAVFGRESQRGVGSMTRAQPGGMAENWSGTVRARTASSRNRVSTVCSCPA
jgi:hypothetical protein